MSIESMLNFLTPAAKRAALGTQIATLIAQVNALRADVVTLFNKNQFIAAKATLVIKATSSAVVKTSTAVTVIAAGSKQTKAADTDMSAIAGTLATAKSALWAFYIDSSGTLSTSTKTTDAASAAAALALKPTVPDNKVEIGYIIVSNATGSNFVGGTTALDATNVTTAYTSNPVTAMTSAALASLG